MNRPARDKSPAFEPRYLDNDLNRSVIMPVERKKYIETIEIVEVDEKEYTKFRVLTSFGGSYNNVFRRYSDFLRLHSFLLHTYCNYSNEGARVVILPKLPDKHSLQDQIYDFDEKNRSQFNQERKEDLGIYLNILAENEVIRQNEYFNEFLSSTELDNFNKHVEHLNIVVPTTIPEKSLQVVKTAMNSLYRYWENWKQSPLEVPDELARKLTRVGKVRSTLSQLLNNERMRMRCINQQGKSLSETINPTKEQPAKLLMSIRTRIGYQSTQNRVTAKHELEQALGKISDMFERKAKDELQHLERISETKREIKVAIAACDAVLEQFNYICYLRPPHVTKLLSQFEALLNLESLFTKAREALRRYTRYYRVVNNFAEI